MVVVQRMDTLRELSDRLAQITQEIYKQEEDKKAMSSSYTATINQLKSTQKKCARMITEGQWTEEDLVDVGCRAAPMEQLMLAGNQGE